jgi:uncharacterized membrane protein
MKRWLGILLLACAAAHAAPPVYRVILLPVPAGVLDGEGYALNNEGAVVGRALAPSLWLGYRAVVWPAGGDMTVLPDLTPDNASDNSIAYGINDAGVIVGGSATGGGFSAAQWTGGAVSPLADLAGGPEDGMAYAINAGGAVAGTGSPRPRAGDPPARLAVRWLPGGPPRNLGDLPGGDTFSLGRAINAAGTVVGQSDAGRRSRIRAFQSRPGEPMQELAPLEGDTVSYGADINDAGVVAGSSGDALDSYAVVWENGVARALGRVAQRGSLYSGMAINRLGVVVGTWSEAAVKRGFFWTEADGMVDLAGQIDPADPLKAQLETDLSPLDVNDKGWILVRTQLPPPDNGVRALLLVPQPAP